MFKLYEALETEVEIDGKTYEVDTSFDTIRHLLDMVSSQALTDGEKVYYGIYLLLDVELELEIDKQVKVFEALIETSVHGGEKLEKENLITKNKKRKESRSCLPIKE